MSANKEADRIEKPVVDAVISVLKKRMGPFGFEGTYTRQASGFLSDDLITTA